MTILPAKARGSVLRRHAMAVAMLAAIPMTAGCVSAVDESSAFGFAASQAAPLAAAAEKTGADKDEKETAAAEPSGGGEASSQAVAAAERKPDTAETEGREVASSGRASVAAYAGGTVAGGRQAGEEETLFTSLFARAKPRTPLANADNSKSRRVLLKRDGAPTAAAGNDGGNALPGVDPSSLLEIGQRTSAADEEDAMEEVRSYQLASLGGMARLAPNGLMAQREDVVTNCFDSKLVGLLKTIERQFGSKVIVTSGYRSPSHNRRVNGAKASQHMACKAADIIIPNANHLQVAAFVRNMPGRGGVGTYCHTKAIHIDTGPERDWNWQCRRRG